MNSAGSVVSCLPVDEPLQPDEVFGGVALLLVAPVRGDAVLGAPVHLDRADLELDRAALRTHHRRVQRLVEVELRHRDVVLEPALHRPPQRVDRAERAVAVLHRVDDDPHADEVVDLGELLAAHDHLLVDRPVVLRAAGHLGVDVQLVEAGAHRVEDVVEVPRARRRAAAPSARSRRSASGAAPRTTGPRAATSRPGCRDGARAARRCRASPARCAAASPRAATRSCACCAGGRRA